MTRPLACLPLFLAALACDDFGSPTGPVDASAPSDASPSTDAGDPDASVGDGGSRGRRRVFVTSKTTAGDMSFGGMRAGGVAGADAECQAEADEAHLVGQFIALLPTSATVAARERFDTPTRNVVLPTGAVVASGFIMLFGNGPTVPISLTADGSSAPPPDTVYTGAPTASTFSTENCAFWTTTVGSGSYGSLAKGTDWLLAPASANLDCKTLRHVYCFER